MAISALHSLNLGRDVATGEKTILRPSERSQGLFVCGSTGTGKSRFLESLIRQDLASWKQHPASIILLDLHGEVYRDIMAWLAWNPLLHELPIIPIDFTQDEYVVGYNALRPRQTSEHSVIVRQFVESMAEFWGQDGVAQTPLFGRWAYNTLMTLYERKLTLADAPLLLDRQNRDVRRALTRGLSDEAVQQDWDYSLSIPPGQFNNEIGSTLNRFQPFSSTRALRRMLGHPTQSLNFDDVLANGHIVLANLSISRERLIHRREAALLATVLMSDLWDAAQARGKGTNRPCVCYLDEFQSMLSSTIAENLDEARGFGLHLVLSCQSPYQLVHRSHFGEQVLEAILANARSKVVFGMAGEKNLELLATELFRGGIDPGKIRNITKASRVVRYEEEEQESVTEGESHSEESGSSTTKGRDWPWGASVGLGKKEKGFSLQQFSAHIERSKTNTQSSSSGSSSATSKSVTRSTVTKPVLGQEVSHVEREGVSEQLWVAKQKLAGLPQRHCFVKRQNDREPLEIETAEVLVPPSSQSEIDELYRTLVGRWDFITPAAKIDTILTQRRQELLQSIRESYRPVEPDSIRRRVDEQ